MATKKTVDVEVKSNIPGSIAELKALKKELKNTAAGSEDFKKLFNEIDDLEDKIKGARQGSSDWIDTLESAGGPIGMLGGALNKAKVSTVSFGTALKATGIGLIVALVGGLVAAFQDNETAMKKLQPVLNQLQRIFQGVFAAIEPLFDVFISLAEKALPLVANAFKVVYSGLTATLQSLGKFGEAIGKLFKGDFSGAWQSAKDSVNDFGKNYDAAAKRFDEGAKQMTKNEKEELEKRNAARKEAAEKAREAAERKAAEDKARAEKEAEEKKKHLEDLQALEDKFTKENEDLKAKSEQQKLDLQKQRDLDEINRVVQTEEEKKKLVALLNEKYALEQADLDAKTKEEKDKKDKEAADKEVADAKTVAEAKLAIQNATLDAAASGIGVLKSVFEKNKTLQKAALIAESAIGISKIVINTQAANAAARVKYALLPGGFALAKAEILLNKVSAGIGIAANVAATAKGLASLGGGGAPSAPSGDSGGGGGTAQAPQFNVVGTSGVNQIAQTLGQQEPIKAYVVANDVTTQQGLDRNIVKTATIG